MTDVPREPSLFRPTTHAKQQRKHRGIEWEQVAETIQDGTVKTSHKDDCYLFIKDFTYTELPVGVVANVKTGEILTVEWRK